MLGYLVSYAGGLERLYRPPRLPLPAPAPSCSLAVLIHVENLRSVLETQVLELFRIGEGNAVHWLLDLTDSIAHRTNDFALLVTQH
ncbi:hypothetical protein KC345_g160 [Hortaea werneckii]|nr:hypothetical protein KC345_g160 [Hortaea werneckii]